MKLRIKGDSIRLRLSQSEVDTFAAEGRVQDRIQFAPGVSLAYGLEMDEGLTGPDARYEGDTMIVRLPREWGTGWARSDRVSIAAEIPNGDDRLRILVEKDFQCLTERPHEDESDNFPHPATHRKHGRTPGEK